RPVEGREGQPRGPVEREGARDRPERRPALLLSGRPARERYDAGGGRRSDHAAQAGERNPGALFPDPVPAGAVRVPGAAAGDRLRPVVQGRTIPVRPALRPVRGPPWTHSLPTRSRTPARL